MGFWTGVCVKERNRIMNRRILAFILALGGVLGIAAGFASHRHHRGFYGHGTERRAAFEAHVADVCTRAAEKVMRESPARGSTPAP